MRSRLSLVQQIIGILMLILLIVFVTGYSMMYRIEYANLDHIYDQTQALLGATIRSVEAELDDVQNTLYNIIVSDTIQTSASEYLNYLDQGNRHASRTCIDVMINQIQQLIKPQPLILCANVLESDSTLHVIASTGYRRLSEAMVPQVEAAARIAGGSPVCIPCDSDTFIIARALREKRDLSMRHVAVVVLYIDISQIAQTLHAQHEAIYFLENSHTGMRFILGTDADTAILPDDIEIPSIDERGFALCDLGNVRYFVTSFHQQDAMFSYTILLPYETAFSQIDHAFQHYTRIYLLCCLLIILLATLLTHYATHDFTELMSYVRTLSDSSFQNTEPSVALHPTNRDSADLYAAFNVMAHQVNELIYENYQKQLLLKETQLASLQAQINPHFLYNTLNSIYWMAKQSGDNRIAEMSDSLSKLLREAVNVSETLIEIDRELEIVLHYVRIQQQRYTQRMQLHFDISDACNNFLIPKFTIQPLLGNAINYGVEKMLEPCAISIRIYVRNGDCICQVRNQGPSPEEHLMEKLRSGEIVPHGTGVGLLNIDQRIRSVFGETYGITVFRDEQTSETVAQARFRCITEAPHKEVNT